MSTTPFRFPANGVRTPVGDSASHSMLFTPSYVRSHALAGFGSTGLVSGGIASASSIQFGSGPTESPANTTHTCTSLEQETTGVEPEIVVTEAGGSQSIGRGRVRWDSETKHLTVYHRADDALVSSCPRVQVYTWPLLQAGPYFRILMQLRFGAPGYPWPAWVSNKNSTLFFQLKSDADSPAIGLDLYDATSGDPALRDIVISRRTLPTDTPVVALRIPNQPVYDGTLHSFILDVGLDWRSVNDGGKAYLALWHNGVQREFVAGGVVNRDPTAYADPGESGYKVPRQMVGIYRYRYSGVQAPDGAGMVVETYRCEVSNDSPPPLHAGGLEIFDGLSVASARTAASQRADALQRVQRV